VWDIAEVFHLNYLSRRFNSLLRYTVVITIIPTLQMRMLRDGGRDYKICPQILWYFKRLSPTPSP
jgi:hypothetical protein